MSNRKEYNKKYYQTHKKQAYEYNKKYHQLHKDQRREYMKQYSLKNKERLDVYREKYAREHRERILISKKKYNFEHKAEHAAHARSKHNRLLLKVGKGKLECIRCGCKDPRFLEINHKFGGGRRDYNREFGRFYEKIESGIRSVNDLELLCRPCNALHFLELKHKQEIPLKVISLNNDWESEL